MNIDANWTVSGVGFDDASNAFIHSAEQATSKLKQYETILNKNFKEHISDNLRRSGMDSDSFADVFSLHISDNSINFINTEPLVTQRYEYGYYDEETYNANEEYYEEYMIQTSPRYFIRPAIQESLQDIGQIMLEEAKKEYMATRKEVSNERQE